MGIIKEIKQYYWRIEETIDPNKTIRQSQHPYSGGNRLIPADIRWQLECSSDDEVKSIHKANNKPFEHGWNKDSINPRHSWQLDKNPTRMDVLITNIFIIRYSIEDAELEVKIWPSR